MERNLLKIFKLTDSFIEKCEVNLSEKSSLRWKGIIKLFENYVGGVGND